MLELSLPPNIYAILLNLHNEYPERFHGIGIVSSSNGNENKYI